MPSTSTSSSGAHYGYWTRLVADAEKPTFFTPRAAGDAARDHAPLERIRA